MPRNNWKDYVWLSWFLLQILVITGIDALPFYPSRLYEPPGSPLHLFHLAREGYIADYNDPIVQWTATQSAGGGSWVPLFTAIELLFQLPTAVWAAWRLGFRRAGTRGADELLCLVYALETALTTLVCLHDVLYWDPATHPDAVKVAVALKIYGPWFFVPALMFVDMYRRLLRRVGPPSLKKTQ